MVSVIIPTLNEEKALRATLEALFHQAGLYEVIVVDGGSSDRTREIADADPRLRFVSAPKGRAVQMNTAFILEDGRELYYGLCDAVTPRFAFRFDPREKNLSARM